MSHDHVSSGQIEFVQSGQTVTSTTVDFGGTEEIFSGGTSFRTKLYGDQVVFSGGLASVTQVESGGLEVDLGYCRFTSIYSGGSAAIYSGATELVETVFNGGVETVSSGGLSSEGIVSSGGVQHVESGGSAVSGVVVGTLYGEGGVVMHDEVYGVGRAYLSNGAVASGSLLSLGGQLTVSGGASAVATDVRGTSVQVVLSGGVAISSLIQWDGEGSGCREVISAGGFSSAATVGSSGLEDIYGVLSTATIGSGGRLTVEAGGSAVSATISSGGAETVDGLAMSGAVVGGAQYVFSGGRVSAMQISGGGQTVVYTGGRAQDLTVQSASLTLQAGAAGVHDEVGDGALEVVDLGARTTSDVVYGTGEIVIFGSAAGTYVASGSDIQVYGSASATGIIGSGSETIFAGAVDSGADVGGVQTVSSGGSACDADVEGLQAISSGGVASGSTASRGTIEVEGGGSSLYTRLLSSGLQLVESGGFAFSATISGGGREVVSGGGVAALGTVQVGGFEVVQSGGVVSGALVGGALSALNGAELTGVEVVSGGVLTLYRGANDVDAEVADGGTLRLIDPVVSSGAVLDLGVASTGFFSGATLMSGAQVLAVNTVVARGGEEVVLPGATTVGGRVTAGGVLDVQAGGRATDVIFSTNAILVDEGTVVVSTAGTATLAAIVSGGGELLKNGPGTLVVTGQARSFTGTAVIGGGVLELAAAGGLGSGAVQFGAAGSATLELAGAARPANGATFADVLSNFRSASDALDLAGRAFVSGATAVVSGRTLTVTERGYVGRFTLGGAHARMYTVQDDGQGGTLIAPVAAGAQSLQTAAAAFPVQAAFDGRTQPEGLAPIHPPLCDASRLRAGTA